MPIHSRYGKNSRFRVSAGLIIFVNMNQRLSLLFRYVKYCLTAGTRHDIHSPFVFAFTENILRDKRSFYSFGKIEALRKALLEDTRTISVTDLGAGSLLQNRQEKRIRDIVRNAAKPPKYAQLLFRMVDYFQARYIVETGTSLGLTTAYLASANSQATIITLEGCPETAKVAQQSFEKLFLDNIKMVTGNFDETLEPVLLSLPRADLVFIDGNHRKEPTLRYFLQCLTKIHDNTVIIFDDIHWTKGMEAAWEEIKGHPSVTLTIDLFFLGLVFFKKEFKEKQHFVLRY